jgi:SAM-dependent methyltransferase
VKRQDPFTISSRRYYWKPLAAYFTALELAVWERHARGEKLAGPILDLSCSDGIWGGMVAEALEIKRIDIGLDLDWRTLEQITKKGVHRLGIRGDARTLPFRDGRFATVFFSKALHEIPEPIRAFSELYRVLKPGGKLFFSCALDSFPRMLLFPRWFRFLGLSGWAESYEKKMAEKRLHHRSDTPDKEGWLNRVREAGFRVEVSETFFTPSQGKIWDVLSLQGLRVFGLLRLIPGTTVPQISATVLQRLLRWLHGCWGGKEDRSGGYLFVKAVR